MNHNAFTYHYGEMYRVCILADLISFLSALGTICPNEWPILKELPAAIKAKASLVAVATYKVEGEEQQHAFIHCIDRSTYYVGSAPQFGSGKYTHTMMTNNHFVFDWLM